RLIKPLNEDAEVRDSFNQAPDSPLYEDIVTESGISTYDEVDIDGAKKLLDEAGADKTTVRFLYDNTTAWRSQLFELIKESATQAASEVEAEGVVNWPIRLGDGNYAVALFVWALSTTAVTESESYVRMGVVDNHGGYDNPDLAK